jgi:hypothetical protein
MKYLDDMGKHLKNLLDGARQALILCPESEYLRPRRGDFRQDAEALRGDAPRVANGLRRALKKERDGQAHYR